jgi:hypothetical protein
MAVAADDPPTPFSQGVTALTGDWVSEDWRDGTLKLHPKMYTWQSDQHLTFYAPEPAAGRSVLDVARLHFHKFSLEDDSLEPTLVDIGRAKTFAPGIVAAIYNWTYAFDNNMSMFGAATLPGGDIVPFRSNCERDDPDLPDQYRFDQCVKQVATLLASIAAGQGGFALPAPPTPMNIPGWNNQYDASGTAIAVNSNMSGTRSATLSVSPPRAIAPADLPKAIKAMSDTLIDDLHDQVDKNAGSMQWVGTTADPWIRRIYPEAFDGPSIHMAGTARTPDGRVSLIGIRCPNENWLASCAKGVELAKLQVSSGILERRRQLAIAATQGPMPTNGIKSAEVFGIYTEGRNTMGAGGFMTGYVIDGPLLFKDGTACNCFDRPLPYIVRAESKAKEPGSWGSWRQVGSKIIVNWADGDNDEVPVQADNFLFGGTAATRLSGLYKHVSGGGDQAFGGGSSWLSQSSYTFFADGTFENDQSSSFIAGGGAGSDGATAMGGSNGGGARGHYQVDGYTMKLTYPDGRISYLGFAQYRHEAGKTAKEMVMINGTVYFRNSDEK